MISRDEWENATSCRFWLVFEISENDELSDFEIMHLVLLSIWLVKPNRVQAHLRFKIGKNETEGEIGRSRILDRMEWIADEENDEFSEDDMRAASNHFNRFFEIYKSRGRLRNAMVLTLNGCWSYYWQAALISHAAAVEAILTYSKGRITHRLATAYACLIEKDQSAREKAYNHFRDLYEIRSDVIHGRAYLLENHKSLPALSRFQKMLRVLWSQVLRDSAITLELEKADEGREVFFCGIANDFEPPVKDGRR